MNDIEPGATVQVNPASPFWRRGGRWGEVLSVRPKKAQALVNLGKLGRLWLSLDDLIPC